MHGSAVGIGFETAGTIRNIIISVLALNGGLVSVELTFPTHIPHVADVSEYIKTQSSDNSYSLHILIILQSKKSLMRDQFIPSVL